MWCWGVCGTTRSDWFGWCCIPWGRVIKKRSCRLVHSIFTTIFNGHWFSHLNFIWKNYLLKTWDKIIVFIIKECSRGAAAWSLPWTRWVQGGGDAYLLGFLLEVGIHSKYTGHIHKFKYRQGTRRTGEHPRDSFSITDLYTMTIATCKDNY